LELTKILEAEKKIEKEPRVYWVYIQEGSSRKLKEKHNFSNAQSGKNKKSTSKK